MGSFVTWSCSLSKLFRSIIKKLLRNFEGWRGHFFKKLWGLNAEVVSYKKNECITEVCMGLYLHFKTKPFNGFSWKNQLSRLIKDRLKYNILFQKVWNFVEFWWKRRSCLFHTNAPLSLNWGRKFHFFSRENVWMWERLNFETKHLFVFFFNGFVFLEFSFLSFSFSINTQA